MEPNQCLPRIRPQLQSETTVRDGHHGGAYTNDWRRLGEELRWLDAERGRFKLTGGSEWTSVNPLFAIELSSAVRQLAAAINP